MLKKIDKIALINKVFSSNQILESIIKITKDKMDHSDNESESS